MTYAGVNNLDICTVDCVKELLSKVAATLHDASGFQTPVCWEPDTLGSIFLFREVAPGLRCSAELEMQPPGDRYLLLRFWQDRGFLEGEA